MTLNNSLHCSESEYTVTDLWQNGISLIPYPQVVVIRGENFLIRSELFLVLDVNASEETKFTAVDLLHRLQDKGINVELHNTACSDHHCIVLTMQSRSLAEEIGQQGYVLSTSARTITIAAHGETGLFYETRTLLCQPIARHTYKNQKPLLTVSCESFYPYECRRLDTA